MFLFKIRKTHIMGKEFAPSRHCFAHTHITYISPDTAPIVNVYQTRRCFKPPNATVLDLTRTETGL